MTRRIISEKTRELIRNHPDEAYEIEMAGLEEGKKHVEPSEKTINLIKSMEDKFDKLKDELLEKVGRIELTLEKTVREIFDRIDDKYARKEKVAGLVLKVEEMEREKEKRSYEWVKYTIITVVSGCVGVLTAFIIMHFR